MQSDSWLASHQRTHGHGSSHTVAAIAAFSQDVDPLWRSIAQQEHAVVASRILRTLPSRCLRRTKLHRARPPRSGAVGPMLVKSWLLDVHMASQPCLSASVFYFGAGRAGDVC
mmetsp:Transcript_32413/g.102970  ORF Transcript_32413/g.102970 Transcript_32413/m.102970 type:complete len:113 (+) Transcript_32413:833-1171(+)